MMQKDKSRGNQTDKHKGTCNLFYHAIRTPQHDRVSQHIQYLPWGAFYTSCTVCSEGACSSYSLTTYDNSQLQNSQRWLEEFHFKIAVSLTKLFYWAWLQHFSGLLLFYLPVQLWNNTFSDRETLNLCYLGGYGGCLQKDREHTTDSASIYTLNAIKQTHRS